MTLRKSTIALAVAAFAALCLTQMNGAALADTYKRLPPAVVSAPPTRGAEIETAYLAGGCFWGVQGVFAHVQGVKQVVSGYAGGSSVTARYLIVGTGKTGHAESVKIDFDPRVISYDEILRIFFSVATDPTQLNRQGPDVGPQYRSEIFYANPRQAEIARDYVAQLGRAKVFARPIVTKINPIKAFYPAEAYHQNYLVLHPKHPYIAAHDIPKVKALKAIFPTRYRASPVLAPTKGA